MSAYKVCKCGAFISPEEDDGDRYIYPEVCDSCQEKRNKKLKLFSTILAECDESECFRAMSYITIRLEYLRGEEMKRLAGIRMN